MGPLSLSRAAPLRYCFFSSNQLFIIFADIEYGIVISEISIRYYTQVITKRGEATGDRGAICWRSRQREMRRENQLLCCWLLLDDGLCRDWLCVAPARLGARSLCFMKSLDEEKD